MKDIKIKKCSKCKVEKPIECFGKTKIGFRSACKDCINKENKNKNYSPDLKIKFKICFCCKKEKSIDNFYKDKKKKDGYRSICNSCTYENNKNWQKRHPEFGIKRQQTIKENRELYLIYAYKRLDKMKKLLGCDLDVKWMKENITSKSCIYCGSTEKLGCDRVNNDKGHTKDNCIPCCQDCNYTRGDIYSVEEMKKIGLVIAQIKFDRELNNLNNLKRRN